MDTAGYLPRGATTEILAQSQECVVKDPGKAALGSPLLPIASCTHIHTYFTVIGDQLAHLTEL